MKTWDSILKYRCHIYSNARKAYGFGSVMLLLIGFLTCLTTIMNQGTPFSFITMAEFMLKSIWCWIGAILCAVGYFVLTSHLVNVPDDAKSLPNPSKLTVKMAHFSRP